jgi:hypothetical protein
MEHEQQKDHHILAKLSPIDRIALGAELAAEGSMVFAQGFLRGLRYAVETVDEICNNSPEVTPDMARGFAAYNLVLLQTAQRYVEEIKKGEASSLYDET